MNLRKKRNGCPGATAATDLVCYLFCWKKKKTSELPEGMVCYFCPE